MSHEPPDAFADDLHARLVAANATIAALKREVEDYRTGRKYDRDPKRFPPAPIDMLSDTCTTIEKAVGMRFGRACWARGVGLHLLRAVEEAARSGDVLAIASTIQRLDEYRDKGNAVPWAYDASRAAADFFAEKD